MMKPTLTTKNWRKELFVIWPISNFKEMERIISLVLQACIKDLAGLRREHKGDPFNKEDKGYNNKHQEIIEKGKKWVK